jgi:hypothetical protein
MVRCCARPVESRSHARHQQSPSPPLLTSHTHLPQSPSSMQRRVPTGQHTNGMQGMHAAAEPVRMTTSDDDEHDARGDAQEYDELAAWVDEMPPSEQADKYTTQGLARMQDRLRDRKQSNTQMYGNLSYVQELATVSYDRYDAELATVSYDRYDAELATVKERTQPKSTPVRATDPFARAWGECSCMHARLGFHARTGAACVWCTPDVRVPHECLCAQLRGCVWFVREERGWLRDSRSAASARGARGSLLAIPF